MTDIYVSLILRPPCMLPMQVDLATSGGTQILDSLLTVTI